MLTRAPKPYDCGTDAGGWLNGSHPLPQDGAVSRQVCFAFSSHTCLWQSTARVVACDNFYLYELSAPPSSCLRYCGNNTAVSPTSEPPTLAPPTYSAQCTAVYRVLSAPSRAGAYTDRAVDVCDDAGPFLASDGAKT